MGIVTPGLGLIVWTTVSFIILLLLLKKFAWKPILASVKEREASIDNALKAAQHAREELKDLQSENEAVLKEARAERDRILKEAREMRDNLVAESKQTASLEADKLIKAAKEQIENEKLAAITELKNQVAELSVEMAERILRKELSDAAAQKDFVNSAISEVKLN